MSGDGNDNRRQQTTFPMVIKEAQEKGWYIELMCWRRTLNRIYQTLELEWRPKFKLVFLDDFQKDLVMTQIDWDRPRTRNTIKHRRYHTHKRDIHKHTSMQEDERVDNTGDENTIRRHNDEEYPVIGRNAQLETETEGPQLPEQVCTMQDSDSVDINMMTRTEPTTPQIVPSVNNVNNPATSEPSSTIREGASSEQKYKYSQNRYRKIQYRNRN